MLNPGKLPGAHKLAPPLVLIAAWLGLGCPPAPQGPGGAGPQAVVQEYADYIKTGQSGQAHRLLSSRSRREISDESFQRFLADDPQRLERQLSELLAAGEAQVELTARLRSSGGVEAVLVREDDHWRLDSGQVVPTLGFSPRTAVEQFVLAIEKGDCQAMLACASPKTLASHKRDKLVKGCRDKLEHLQEIAAQIRQAGGQPQLVSKDRAELTYHQNKKLIVIRYESRWYIEDL